MTSEEKLNPIKAGVPPETTNNVSKEAPSTAGGGKEARPADAERTGTPDDVKRPGGDPPVEGPRILPTADFRSIIGSCSSWSDFQEALRPLDAARKGRLFEEFVQHYLRLHPEYATVVVDAWPLRDIPEDVRRGLGLPDADEGVDIVARTVDGEMWAVQCKYRGGGDRALTRRELGTFTDLAFGVCRGFSLALVCSNATRRSPRLDLHGVRIAFRLGEEWSGLGEEYFASLKARLGGRPSEPPPLEPRPHQQAAVDDAWSHFAAKRSARGRLVMPCGAGKSLCGLWIADALEAVSVLVAVPSLQLIRQTLSVWARQAAALKRDVRWICVCGDDSVGGADGGGGVVQDLGVRVHSDPAVVADWLRTNKGHQIVVMSTYQSGRVVAEAARRAGFEFDLGILDEAHRTAGRLDSLFAHLLHDGNIAIARRLFMTATERARLGPGGGTASMDDPSLYGEVFHHLTYKSAIKSVPPVLSDYRILVMGVEAREIADLLRRNVIARPEGAAWDEGVETRVLAGAIALRKAMLSHPVSHAISYHSSVARAKAFKDLQDRLTAAIPALGPLETFHLNGRQTPRTRGRRLERFARAERALATNARCLVEGVDAPGVDAVLFADPRTSAVDIVQAVGRTLRLAPDKSHGHVIIPVVVGEGGDADAALEGTGFEVLAAVVRALGVNDERVMDYFRASSQGLPSSARAGSVVEIHAPDGAVISVDALARAIELRCWERLEGFAWRPFEEARRFVQGLGVKSEAAWRRYVSGGLPDLGLKPRDIPARPDVSYRGAGWVSHGDWLGTGNRRPRRQKTLTGFAEARAMARGLGLDSRAGWNEYCRGRTGGGPPKPDGIPFDPSRAYKNHGWTGWGDWLGTDRAATRRRKYRGFESARGLVRGLALKSQTEWNSFVKGLLPGRPPKPGDIPCHPDRIYRDKGWTSWGDWLGTGSVANFRRDFRPFEAARGYARGLGLRTQAEWFRHTKGLAPGGPPLPGDIPVSPPQTYKGRGWAGWRDWLGTVRGDHVAGPSGRPAARAAGGGGLGASAGEGGE